MMKKNSPSDLPSLEPEVKEAGYRILERAFGEFGKKNGTPEQLRTALVKEIIIENPELKDDPAGARAVARMLMAHFFEIVSDETTTPTGKKYNEILDKFIADSVAKTNK